MRTTNPPSLYDPKGDGELEDALEKIGFSLTYDSDEEDQLRDALDEMESLKAEKIMPTGRGNRCCYCYEQQNIFG